MGEQDTTEYLRDGRAPIPKSKIISQVMSANRGKNTNPELSMRKSLRDIGLSGYRLHWKKAPGRPDISYPKKKIAIFVNGCFWHRCPHCRLPLPKSNIKFWQEKFNNNKLRDKQKKRKLETNGWKVFIFWECSINEDAKRCANEVKQYIKKTDSEKTYIHL